LYRVVCGRGVNRYSIRQFIAYDKSDGVMEIWEKPNDKLKAAIPGSMQEAVANAVCRRVD
jgi:hypothetical protein